MTTGADPPCGTVLTETRSDIGALAVEVVRRRTLR